MGDFGTIRTLPPGFLLGGRYEIQRVIGQGGMGVVYLAKDKHLDDEVRAIKTIRPELLADVKGLKSLKQEAMASMRLAHPHIVRIFNYEEDQGISFIVMEYVEGKTLAEVLAQIGRFAEEEFLPLAKQLCAALDYAHRQGIVHQDIKPANVFMTSPDEAKLADFGIARTVKDTTTRLTGKMASGTLIYMSPEALRGEKPAALSDIYSQGITFYEMLSGEPPFVRGDITWQHINQPPQAIEGISELLNRAVLKALEKEPENRPSSAGEYLELLSGEVVISEPKGPVPVSRETRKSEELVNSIGMKFRLIPAGTFMLGASPDDSEASSDEKPQHLVEITKPFFIEICTVTQAQWKAVMGTTVRQQRDKANKEWPLYGEGPGYPIYFVNWEEAVEFCRRLSQMTGEKYRLPSEAEWEYACRAGTETKYCWGDNDEEADDHAWYDHNSGGETHEVGRKSPNDWGLYDMSGNVWEWCQDLYDENYYSKSPAVDPVGPSSGGVRVLRGGGWDGSARWVRISVRYGCMPIHRVSTFGFRIVRDAE